MKPLIALFLATVLSGAAGAQEPYWRDRSGNPIPDTPNQKSESGFAAWLIVTPDEDWRERWETPPETTPSYSEASTVRVGEKLFTLIFFANPKENDDGIAEVRCNIKVIRPDGSYSVNLNDFECFKGSLHGRPLNLRMSAATLGFTGEPADLRGVWVTEVTLIDSIRGVSLDLTTSFELTDDEA